MRGERTPAARRAASESGSSPHARGTLETSASVIVGWRFIPACAGNARRILSFQGEFGGSSPHARGTRLAHSTGALNDRFIPACAGNASSRSMPGTPSTVHPRMRGERDSMIGIGFLIRGSSPHARGTPMGSRQAGPVRRFIPACAGNARFRGGADIVDAVHPRMRGERVIPKAILGGMTGSSPHARGTRTRARPGRR